MNLAAEKCAEATGNLVKRALSSRPGHHLNHQGITRTTDQSISYFIDLMTEAEVICFQYRMEGNISSAAEI